MSKYKTKKKQVAVYFFEEDIETIKKAVESINKTHEELGYRKMKVSAFISDRALTAAEDIVKDGF